MPKKIKTMETMFSNPGFKIAMIKLTLKLIELLLIELDKRKTRSRRAITNESITIKNRSYV